LMESAFKCTSKKIKCLPRLILLRPFNYMDHLGYRYTLLSLMSRVTDVVVMTKKPWNGKQISIDMPLKPVSKTATSALLSYLGVSLTPRLGSALTSIPYLTMLTIGKNLLTPLCLISSTGKKSLKRCFYNDLLVTF
jgi:hypothetical protein